MTAPGSPDGPDRAAQRDALARIWDISGQRHATESAGPTSDWLSGEAFRHLLRADQLQLLPGRGLGAPGHADFRPRPRPVRVTFSLPAGEPAGVVSVVGDFNEWCPGRHVLVRRSGGTRSVAVDLAPGTHAFRYLATIGVWFGDPTADQITDNGSVIEV